MIILDVTLTGALSWIFNICVLGTSGAIIILGTWAIMNRLIWEILVKQALIYLKLYKSFVRFLFYQKRFNKWYNKYEGKTEEGAND